MEENSSAFSIPKRSMDWSGSDLPSAWKAFEQQCEFALGGIPKQKSEEVKCSYLLLWFADEGRE